MNKWLLGLLIIGGGFALLVIVGAGLVGVRVYNLWNNPDAQFNRHNIRGDNFYSQHQLRNAETEYSAMIALRPNRSRGYYMRGQVERELKNYGQGIRDAESAMRLATQSATRAESYEHRGDCYQGLQDFKRALADYNEAEERNDTNFSLYVSRAACYEQLKQYKKAARDYRILVNAAPVIPDYYVHYAEVLAKSGDVGGAVKASRQTAERFPYVAGVWGDLGWNQYLADQIPDAIRSDKKALKMDANASYVAFNLALCYAVQGKTDDARALYLKTCQGAAAPETRAALDDVQTALKKNPGSPTLNAMRTLLQSHIAKPAAAKVIRRPAPTTEAAQ